MIDPNGGILDQLEALRGVILRCLAGVVIAGIPGYIFSPSCLQYMIKVTCPEGLKLHYFTPMEPFMVQIQMGFVLGVIVSSWWIFWQIGAFAAPGLYKHEKSSLLKFTISSVVLFLSGGAFAFYAVLPMVMKFSYSFATGNLQPVIGVGDFLSMATMVMLGFAVSFQFPVVLILLAKLGIVKLEFLSSKRPVFITVIFIIAALLTPPDIISQLAMALPACLLYEITLLIIKYTVPQKKEDEASSGKDDKNIRNNHSLRKDEQEQKPARRRRIRPL